MCSASRTSTRRASPCAAPRARRWPKATSRRSADDMPLELWLAFAAASAVLLVIPGPTILTVISYSVAHGRRANVPLVAAVALGDSTALVLSLLGLGALLATSALWFTLVKWLGGLYLVFL